jgi:hypothetical protein
MGKTLPQKSSAEISRGVKRPVGEEIAGGEQDCGDAATAHVVGGTLNLVRTFSLSRAFVNL